MSATKRLWANRFSRAGWLLAPVLSAVTVPFWGPKWLWNASGEQRVVFLFVVFMSSLFATAGFSLYDGRVATAADIKYYRSLDACTADLIPRRETSKPMTVNQLRQAKSDCDRFTEEQRILREQKAAWK